MPVLALTSWFEFVNLSLFSLITIGCEAKLINQFDRLMIITLLPLSIIGLCLIIHLAMKLPCVKEVRPTTGSCRRCHDFTKALCSTGGRCVCPSARLCA